MILAPYVRFDQNPKQPFSPIPSKNRDSARRTKNAATQPAGQFVLNVPLFYSATSPFLAALPCHAIPQWYETRPTENSDRHLTQVRAKNKGDCKKKIVFTSVEPKVA